MQTAQHERHRNVIIIGGGPVGMAQALALAAHGLSSHLIDRMPPETALADGFDGRTFAISCSTQAMFDLIGVGAGLAGKGAPIDRIWVSDGLKPGSLDFTPAPDEGPLGTMYESRVLRRALYDAVAQQPLITVHAPANVVARDYDAHAVTVTLDEGRELTGALLIAAEGRNSDTRDAAGLRSAQWDYDHTALVGAITHVRTHTNTAYEIFYPAGPFALLPMADDAGGRHRSAFVWSVPRRNAPGYIKMPETMLLDEMRKAMHGMLGEIALAAPISSYPLAFHHTARIIGHRLALIGDCAHSLHPIAGQGINLGFRDVAALTEVLVDGARLGLDAGDAQLLARYQRWRAADTLAVATATDGLNRLFAVPGRTASAVRRLGLSAVQRTPHLRRFFIDEARGTSGRLPKLLQGIPV